MTEEVFTSRDVVVTFRDGKRTGEKEEITLTLEDASLFMTRPHEVQRIRTRNGYQLRRGEENRVDVALSWKYANKDIYDVVPQFTTAVTTSGSKNICPSPSDFNHDWNLTNLYTPMYTNGVSPDGVTIAQRLAPMTTAGGSMSTNAQFIPQTVDEQLYVDFWAKAQVPHNTAFTTGVTVDGGSPGSSVVFPVTVKKTWTKYTTGVQCSSTFITTETLSFQIRTEYLYLPPVGYKIDIWGVDFRRDMEGVTKTWDMYIDIYKNGALDHTLMIEKIAYESISFGEGAETSWGLSLKSTTPRIYTIFPA